MTITEPPIQSVQFRVTFGSHVRIFAGESESGADELQYATDGNPPLELVEEIVLKTLHAIRSGAPSIRLTIRGTQIIQSEPGPYLAPSPVSVPARRPIRKGGLRRRP
jgi:hypothetical protein